MAAGPVFPGFIRVEYKTDGSSKSKFLAEAAQLSGEIKKPFSEAFDQIGKMVDRVSGKLKDGSFALDLDTSSLRQATAQADFTAKKMAALRDAALQVATANKDQSESTVAFVKALQAQAAEAERVSQTTRDQLTTYTNLERAVSSLTRENQALAQSYRDTYLEQAKVANAAYRAQQQFNALSAPGLDRPAKSARDSASAFTTQFNPGPTKTRSGVDALVSGEASLDRAAISGVKLEQVLGRVSVKGKEVAAALKEAAAAADKAANVETGPRRANPGPTNTRSGADALVAGQASLDRAAISATTLEQVLGRVANKGREVGAALAEAERAAAGAAKEREAAEAAASAAAEKVKAQASDELKRLAEAADTLNARLNPAIGIQQRYNNEIENARNLLKAGVIDQNLYAQAVQSAAEDQASALKVLEAAQEQANQSAKRGTSEQQNVINSIRSQRVAFIQLGQQMQDVAVQAQMGTSAITIFSQQVPQAAFALSGLEGNANETLDKVGEFATFLSGPWGAALFAATAFLGPLVFEVLGFGNAADEAKGKTYDFTNGLDGLVLSANEATSAFAQLSKEISSAISLQGDFLKSRAIAAEQGKREFSALYQREQAELKALKDRVTDLNPFNDLNPGEIYRMNTLAANQTRLKGIIDEAGIGVSNSRIALAQQRALEAADPRAAIEGRYKRQVGELEKRFRRSIDAGNDPLAKATGQDSLTDAEYQSELTRLTVAKNKEIEGLKKTRTPKGPDAAKEAERAAKAAIRLGEFGEDAGKKIANIRDSFADIPPEVERVNKATRELDDIISDLQNRKPANFKETIAEAEALKKALPEMGFARVMRQVTADAQQQVQYQMLILQGRDGEAQALQNIYQIEQNLGPLRKEQKDQIIATGIAIQRINEQMQRAQEIQGVFLESTRSVRAEVEGILGGYGSLASLGSVLKRQFQNIQGKVLTEQIFGDLFRDMDRYVKEKTGIGSSVDMLAKETERAGTAAGDFAEAITAATARIMGGGSASGGIVAGASAVTAWGNLKIPDSIRNPAYDGDPNGPIVVEAAKKTTGKTVNELTPQEYFSRFSNAFAQKLTASLAAVLGGRTFLSKFSGTLSGAISGYAQLGTKFGAGLGAARGLMFDYGKDLFGEKLGDKILGGLDKAFAGAQTGQAVAGISNALGIKMSNTGAQIGGAIGNFIRIPGGQIIGSIAGGLLGNLFGKKVNSGYAQVRNGSVVGTYGRTKDLQNDASEAAGGLVDTIASLAKTLNVRLGAYDFDYGKKDNKYVVNTGARGVRTFDNEQQAMEFAVREAVADGAFIGIKDAQKRLLMASGDLQAQVEKAVKFGDVFKQLKAIKDPVGAALDDLNSQFSDLIDIFKEAGASAEDLASLEELYGLKRKDAIKQAMESAIGPLKSLMQNITVGSDFYSLRDRQASAQAVYNPLAERVKSGDMTAYAEFSDAAQSLIDINRQLYGSTSPFYDFLDSVKALTNGALTSEQAKIDAASASDSPFSALASQQQATTSAIDAQTQALIAALGGINENLVAALQIKVANNNSGVDVTSLLSSRGAW